MWNESFRKSGFKRGVVLGKGFIYMEMLGESFSKSGLKRVAVSQQDGLSLGVALHQQARKLQTLWQQ